MTQIKISSLNTRIGTELSRLLKDIYAISQRRKANLTAGVQCASDFDPTGTGTAVTITALDDLALANKAVRGRLEIQASLHRDTMEFDADTFRQESAAISSFMELLGNRGIDELKELVLNFIKPNGVTAILETLPNEDAKFIKSLVLFIYRLATTAPFNIENYWSADAQSLLKHLNPKQLLTALTSS